MLTKADDYPVHQTPEPIAFAGTDRNFATAISSMAIAPMAACSLPPRWVFIRSLV